MIYTLSVFYNAPAIDHDIDTELSEVMKRNGYTAVLDSWNDKLNRREMLYERVSLTEEGA